MYEELQEWYNNNRPKENMTFKDCVWPQIKFLRDTIPSILARSYEEYIGIQKQTMVVGTHTSKSIKLPVTRIKWNGYTFTLRDNFHDWVISVCCPYKVKLGIDFLDIIKPDCRVPHYNAEGFSKSWVYGTYEENSRQFTTSVPDNYAAYTFFWILKHHVHGGTHGKEVGKKCESANITEIQSGEEVGDQQVA